MKVHHKKFAGALSPKDRYTLSSPDRPISRLRNVIRRLRHGARDTSTGPDRHPKNTFKEFFQHVKTLGFQPGTIFDVGVAEGTPPLYRAFPDAQFILVEPIEEFVPAMEEIAKDYNATYILAAAGPECAETSIRVYGGLTGSTIVNVYDKPASATGGQIRRVPMIALDSLFESHSIEAPVLLKLDVQGAELLALQGAARVLDRSELVVMETSLFRFHENMPQLDEVVAFMKERGFVVYDIIGGHLRPRDEALGQVDLVFVKEHGRFRESHDWG